MPYDLPDDPAHTATHHPEHEQANDSVSVVGIGPGDPELLTRCAQRVIADADVVLGFERVINRVREEISGDVLACSYDNEQEMIATFARRVGAGAAGVVVMMGDPNFSDYQFLGKIEDGIPRPISVIPGISSVQIAASRARTPIEDSTFVTLHKRGPIESDLQTLALNVGDRHLLIHPRPYDWMPSDIASFLIDQGAPTALETFVFERLTHPDEQVAHCSLEQLAGHKEESESSGYSDMSIMVVKRPLP